jgi:hypothetical protein
MKRGVIKRQGLDEDGFWIYLKSGWCDTENPGCHTIVEATRDEAHAHRVHRCRCRSCIGDLARASAVRST